MMSTTPDLQPAVRDGQGGYVWEATLRVVLLLVIVGQVVFLASRYRTRVDVTADKLFTMTASTQRVLSGLDERLLIEAYFSPPDKLPQVLRDRRRALNNFLDELVELGDGMVVLQRFNPHSDTTVEERAHRLGIRAENVSESGASHFSFQAIWQGLRLLYSGDRQDVISFVPMYYRQPAPTARWEALLTPRIKALTVAEKPLVGLLAYPTEAAPGSTAHGYTKLAEMVQGHYDIEKVDLSEGQLVPEKYQTLVLIRPKNLSDRQKYAIDQLLMRGGSLLVFADTYEVEIGKQRTFQSRKVRYDLSGSDYDFLDQLAHYGAVVQEKVINEGLKQARGPGEKFMVVRQTLLGVRAVPLEPYPYWFHALPIDYADHAEDLAARSAAGNGSSKQELAARYRETFKPGMELDNNVLKALGRGPGMFWACPVGLADDLPEGVEGDVLLRTSPFAWLEDPPPTFNPIGMSPQPLQRQAAFKRFCDKIRAALTSEPRQQFGLMVHLQGTFPSFFAGKEIPLAKEPEPEPDAATKASDPLAEPITADPLAKSEVEAGEPAAPAGETEATGPPASGAAAEAAAEPASEDSAEPELEPLLESPASARLIVIGDADMVRDDLLGQYQRMGGPVSHYGPTFFKLMLDWLAGDQDLLELATKTSPDRTLELVAAGPVAATQPDYLGMIRDKERLLTVLNVAVPFGAIMLIWLLVSVRRRARKQSFLASVEE